MPRTSSMKRSVKGVTLLYTVLTLLIIALTLAGLSTYLTYKVRKRSASLARTSLRIERLTTGKQIYAAYLEQAYGEQSFTPYETLTVEGLTYPDLLEGGSVAFRNEEDTIAYAVGDIRFEFDYLDSNDDGKAQAGEFSSLRSLG